MQKKNKFEIISFYKFIKLINLENLRPRVKKYLIDNFLKGTIILSPEGINGTISGPSGFVRDFNNFISKNFSFESYDVINISGSVSIPFKISKVKIKKEVVPIDKTIINREGNHIEPKKWNNFMQREDVIVIDIRKPFENKIGTFKSAINPNVNSFRQFQNYFDNLIKKNKKKIAIFCTGGVRCEKASAYLKDKGVDDVYQLQGGILNYINTIPEKKSFWNGECFVFDRRISIKHNSLPGSYSMCYACRMPVNKKEMSFKEYNEGISCHYCYNKLSVIQKKKFAMRQKNKKNRVKKR